MQKLKTVTLFSGIGMQERGINESNCFECELIVTSDIDKDSILSYSAIHCGLTNDLVSNYEEYPNMEKMVEELKQKHIGFDFLKQKEYDWQKLAKRDFEKLKKYWLAVKLSKNMGDISLIDELPLCDLLTFSFPCTDISINGKQRGFSFDDYNNDNCSRSGLIWNVIRLLKIDKLKNKLPKYLLMENVYELVNTFKTDFENLNKIFSEIGYNSYYDVMTASDFGVPQMRKRVFGVYIRKDLDKHNFRFPMPMKLECKIKDILDKDVPSKYYLNDKKLKNLVITDYDLNKNKIGVILSSTFKKHQHQEIMNANKIMKTLTFSDCKEMSKICIKENEKFIFRNLTPYECFALMSMKKEDCQKCLDVGVLERKLYSQCGNGLVCYCVTLLMQHLYKAQFDENFVCDDEKIIHAGDLF